VLTASAYRPLVQCQPSITEVSEQLSQLSVINGRLWQAAEFGQFCHGEPRNFASWTAECGKKISAENCGLHIIAYSSRTHRTRQTQPGYPSIHRPMLAGTECGHILPAFLRCHWHWMWWWCVVSHVAGRFLTQFVLLIVTVLHCCNTSGVQHSHGRSTPVWTALSTVCTSALYAASRISRLRLSEDAGKASVSALRTAARRQATRPWAVPRER